MFIHVSHNLHTRSVFYIYLPRYSEYNNDRNRSRVRPSATSQQLQPPRYVTFLFHLYVRVLSHPEEVLRVSLLFARLLLPNHRGSAVASTAPGRRAFPEAGLTSDGCRGCLGANAGG